MKRVLSVILSIILLSSMVMLAGCGQTSTSSSNGGSTGGGLLTNNSWDLDAMASWQYAEDSWATFERLGYPGEYEASSGTNFHFFTADSTNTSIGPSNTIKDKNVIRFIFNDDNVNLSDYFETPETAGLKSLYDISDLEIYFVWDNNGSNYTAVVIRCYSSCIFIIHSTGDFDKISAEIAWDEGTRVLDSDIIMAIDQPPTLDYVRSAPEFIEWLHRR